MDRDRRQHQRHQKQIPFYCYIDGHRFDTDSMDVSAGGAFMASDDDVRLGAVVMIVPKREMKKRLPVVLVGVVRRHQQQPVTGLGIQWRKCVTRNGIQQIFDFLALYLELFPAKLPLPKPEVGASRVVAYDFLRKEFSIPDLPPPGEPTGMVKKVSPAKVLKGAKPKPSGPSDASSGPSAASPSPPKKVEPAGPVTAAVRLQVDTPAPAAEPPKEKTDETGVTAHVESILDAPPTRSEAALGEQIMSPPEYDRSEEDGLVTTVLKDQRGRIPVKIPVQFFLHDKILDGVVRFLGTSSLYMYATAPADLKDHKFLLAFPIPLQEEKETAFLICSVRSVKPVEGGGSGHAIDIKVEAVQQEPKEGVFERYVKFLYFKMLTTT